MPLGIPEGAMCVQRFDDSLNSAIHITYRISLRSSSMREPRDPLLKVLIIIINTQTYHKTSEFGYSGEHLSSRSLAEATSQSTQSVQ